MGRGPSDYEGVRAASGSSIEIDFYHPEHGRCRERIKMQPTAANMRRAAQHRAAILDAINAGTFDYAVTFPQSKRGRQAAKREKPLTMRECLEVWLKRARPYLKASSQDAYRKSVAFISADLGQIPLTELTRRDVRDWIAGLNVSNGRVKQLLIPLRAALREAADDELIEANPIEGWRPPRRRGLVRTDHVDPFTTEERDAIIAAAHGQGRNLIRFAFWTGMRTSELVALDWGDIDFVGNVARISRSWTTCSPGPEEPKTGAGARDVKLLPEALRALKDQKQYTFLKGQEVFQNPHTQQRWKGDQPIRRTMWAPALKRAGVRYRNPYQTRHTFASQAIMAGESIQWVADMLGHTQWAFTARVYTRYIPAQAPDAGEKMARKM